MKIVVYLKFYWLFPLMSETIKPHARKDNSKGFTLMNGLLVLTLTRDCNINFRLTFNGHLVEIHGWSLELRLQLCLLRLSLSVSTDNQAMDKACFWLLRHYAKVSPHNQELSVVVVIAVCGLLSRIQLQMQNLGYSLFWTQKITRFPKPILGILH